MYILDHATVHPSTWFYLHKRTSFNTLQTTWCSASYEVQQLPWGRMNLASKPTNSDSTPFVVVLPCQCIWPALWSSLSCLLVTGAPMLSCSISESRYKNSVQVWASRWSQQTAFSQYQRFHMRTLRCPAITTTSQQETIVAKMLSQIQPILHLPSGHKHYTIKHSFYIHLPVESFYPGIFASQKSNLYFWRRASGLRLGTTLETCFPIQSIRFPLL